MRSKTVRKGEAPRARNARGEGERLRDEILAAAIKVLSTIGPEDPFTLRAVAKEAKIAPPSVYIHFADRNVLLLAVLEKLIGEQYKGKDALIAPNQQALRMGHDYARDNLADVCGLAADKDPACFWATSGLGDVVKLRAGETGLVTEAHWQAAAAFDNHLLRL